jgi:hypothetical protein
MQLKSEASLLPEMAEMRQRFFCFFTIFSLPVRFADPPESLYQASLTREALGD